MRFKNLLFALLVAVPALSQIPAPQLNLTGNIGCQGFPCLNSGSIVMPSDANYTMTSRDTSATGGIKVTSLVSLTATRNIILPAGNFQFIVAENATTGGQAIQFIGPTGTGLTLPNGSAATIWFDGTNVVGTTQSTNALSPRYVAPGTVFNVDYYATLLSTSTCTAFSDIYATDCAQDNLIAYSNANGKPPVALQFGVGTYQHAKQIVQPTTGYNQSSESVLGSVNGMTFLQAMAVMGPQVYHAPGGIASVYGQVSNIYFNANRLATGCLEEDNVVQWNVINVGCGGVSMASKSYVGINLGGNGVDDNMFVSNLQYGANTGHSGLAADLIGNVTAGAISSFTVGLQAASASVTAGSGYTNGTFTWVGTGGGCINEPSGPVTVAGGSLTTASVGAYSFGYDCISPPTVAIPSGAGAGTGGAITLTTNTGGTGYSVSTDSSGAVLPVTFIFIGNIAGTQPCATMPTNQPIPTYDSNHRFVSLALLDGTVASTGAGCTGPVRVYAYSTDPINDPIVFNFPDSTVQFVSSDAGIDSCIDIAGGGSWFYTMHPYGACGLASIKFTGGNNTVIGTELDSPNGAGFYVANGTQTLIGTALTYDAKSNYSQSCEVSYAAGSGSVQQMLDGHTDGLPADSADYNKYCGATGPMSTGASAMPTGLFNDLHAPGEANSAGNSSYFGIPITGPVSTGLQFEPFLASNATNTTRSLLMQWGGFKYLNSSTPNGYYPWTVSVLSSVGANTLNFTPPTTDPTIVANSGGYSVNFNIASVPNASQNFNSPVFSFAGAGCATISGGACGTYVYPSMGFSEVLNPSTLGTGGALTSVQLAWGHNTNTLPFSMTMPYTLYSAGINTPGVIVSPLATPTFTATPFATGGTLTAGTYCYTMTAISQFGETIPSGQQCATTTGSTGEVKIQIQSGVANAWGYNIYGRTSGSQLLLTPFTSPSVAGVSQSASLAFTDTGAVTPGAAPPTQDGSMAPASYQPLGSTPLKLRAASITTGTTSGVLFFTGSFNTAYTLKQAINCHAVGASTPSLTMSIGFTDTSGHFQSDSLGAINCSSLGPASESQSITFRNVQAGTSIGYSIVATGSGTAVIDASAVVIQDEQN